MEENKKTELVVNNEVSNKTNEIVEMKDKSVSIFSDKNLFEEAQRVAMMLTQSSLVPLAYQKNVPNAMIALEMSNRIGISPFMVMQNMDIIHGKPSWSSSFVIAVLNSCGRFEPLKFRQVGTENTDSYGYVAYTKDKDGNDLVSPAVTWDMVRKENWLNKSGSKWKTMPELMFQYRAASFFGRLYASDILKGMQSVEESQDSLSSMKKIDNLDQLK